MMRSVVAILLLAVGCHVRALEFNDTSKLMIHIPHELYKPEGYAHRPADFGVPSHGGSIALQVFYADSDLCDPNVDYRTKGYPQRDVNTNGTMEKWPSPFLLMVDRGSCTFVTKVRNAQHLGASAVIIADDRCMCSDSDCMKKIESQSCETKEPVLTDDGSGSDVSIPSALISWPDGQMLQERLKHNQVIQMEFVWGWKKQKSIVEYEIWTVPHDTNGMKFLTGFKHVAVALGDKVKFTPHLYVHDGIRFQCPHAESEEGTGTCGDLCTNYGRYCATNPIMDENEDKEGTSLSGVMSITEGLRRMCIWTHYGDDGIGAPWWNYVENFVGRCTHSMYFANDDCIADVYKHAQIDDAIIKQCMEDSGGLDHDGHNSAFDLSIAEQTDRGVVILPSVYINGVPHKGPVAVQDVFEAICKAFYDEDLPEVCKRCGASRFSPECFGHGGDIVENKPHRRKHPHRARRVWITLFILALLGGAGYWYYRKMRDEQGTDIIADYMPFVSSSET